MKYLKYFESLNDVYELSVKKIKDDNFSVDYTFNDDKGNDFLVQFKNISSKVMDRKILGKEYTMSYFVKNGTICGEDNWSVSKLVNSNPLRIVKTVFGKITNDFLNEKKWCNKLHIEGLSKDNEKDFVSQRTKMYVRYLIQNPIVGFKMETPRDINSIYSNKIVLKRNH